MSEPGWYPDPGGAPGRFRYWSGTAWSPETSATPGAAPAGAPGGGSGGGSGGGRAKWVIGIVAVVVVGFLVVLGVRALINTTSLAIDGGGNQATVDPCPPMPTQAQSEGPDVSDGRVHAGGLSYPLLGAPWSPPQPEYRLAFGVDVFTQTAVDQDDFDGRGTDWVSSILLARLLASDGAVAPQMGVDIVVKCIVGTFYGDAVVDREDLVYEEHDVDGHDGWLIESHLSFDIPGLVAKGELMIILVVSTSPETSAIYYASIPDTQPDLVDVARKTMNELRVDT